jgi:antitoxin component of MazEF toxin-antitoxin module
MAVQMLGLHAGQSVNLTIENNRLVLQKESPRYKLSELVAQMHPKNEPDLIWDDAPQGEEIL